MVIRQKPQIKPAASRFKWSASRQRHWTSALPLVR